MIAKRLLKRCPMCGGRAVLSNERPDWATPMYVAMCRIGCVVSPENEDKQHAIDWWNRRYTGPMWKK